MIVFIVKGGITLKEPKFVGLHYSIKCLPDNQLLMSEILKYINMLFPHQRKNIKLDASKEKLLSQMTSNINNLYLRMIGWGGQAWVIIRQHFRQKAMIERF